MSEGSAKLNEVERLVSEYRQARDEYETAQATASAAAWASKQAAVSVQEAWAVLQATVTTLWDHIGSPPKPPM